MGLARAGRRPSRTLLGRGADRARAGRRGAARRRLEALAPPRAGDRASPSCPCSSTRWRRCPSRSCWCSTTCTCCARASAWRSSRFLVMHAPETLRLVLSARARSRAAAARAARARADDRDPRDRPRVHRGRGGRAAARARARAAPRLVRALRARTEGWGAGLRLAALSLQGRDDAGALRRRVRRRRPRDRRLPARRGARPPAAAAARASCCARRSSTACTRVWPTR